MKKDEVVSWLTNLCQDKDWFHSVGFDQYGRAVVYVKYMDGDVLRFVPDWTEDHKQVLCHFAASAPNAKNELISKPHPQSNIVGFTVEDIEFFTGTLPMHSLAQEKKPEVNVRALTDELDRLEKSCGTNVLQDVFYETHDKGNAVTNLSARFPEIRQRMQKLYDKYGFDVIYNELDG